MKSNEINEIKWNKVKWSETKRNQVKSSDIKWNQVKPNETKWNQLKWSDIKLNQMRWHEIKSNQAKPSEIKWVPTPSPQSSYPTLVGFIGMFTYAQFQSTLNAKRHWKWNTWIHYHWKRSLTQLKDPTVDAIHLCWRYCFKCIPPFFFLYFCLY